MTWLLIPLFGIFHRLRGSDLAKAWFGFGLGLARVFCWATPCAVLCWLILGYGLWESLGILLGLFIGSVYGQPGHINMGRRYDGTIDLTEWREDFSAAALRGLHWTAYPALALVYTRPTAAIMIALSGLLTPVAYELGWRTRWSPHSELNEGAEWGEVYLGCFIGAALILGSVL